ncbi:Dol-P-Glc:Glc-PP-Dol alpha-1,2-glucosyltransferase [Golovinomyces cichoracearum]|uniref:Dol-P-Glc:Glc(2)Man(9)GlcNAc(2)-PP-Dol alpha-1,2-glucosyltransferase n=1 Tax=Golovinomyces cichoracearum TaxID=62708 RepID=A0A420IQZ9_9PEZI|nr:Dol-P-Glc:Glc-PP-Dol alpha-1,2-glucosyltransferase [Golovinomyces cichoracearum]
MFDIFVLCVILPILTFRHKSITSYPSKIYFVIAFGTLYALVSLWTSYVNNIVPDPYLDEAFHIPQAQAYCNGRFDVWDGKLATPPGLYIFALLKELSSWNLTGTFCDILALRSFNRLALLISYLYLLSCRFHITHSIKDAIHTAFNIALFPPLFFTSALFYTDILSLCSVLVMYKFVLDKKELRHKTLGSLWLMIIGVISLTTRQTNIFWVTIFTGGLELVNTLVSLEPKEVTPNMISNGRIHDIQLNEASFEDFFIFSFCVLMAAICQPKFVLREFWPYIALLVTFGGFVIWNGGVALVFLLTLEGDKINHIATIHLPQMLYIWPLITFFSGPLMIPIGMRIIKKTKFFISSKSHSARQSFQSLTNIMRYSIGATALILVVIKYNTIIHPFTLADNRHYMFYVFRYTILRHPAIRFLLTPVYIICSCFVYLALSTPTPAVKPLENSNPYPAIKSGYRTMAIDNSVLEYRGPKISLAIILLITTTLSLTTSPLVEPRYFIIPWVLFRLNMPLVFPDTKTLHGSNSSAKIISKEDNLTSEKNQCSRMDSNYLIWIETFWFLSINLATAYTFLYCGFEWPQEPGTIQRFMW